MGFATANSSSFSWSLFFLFFFLLDSDHMANLGMTGESVLGTGKGYAVGLDGLDPIVDATQIRCLEVGASKTNESQHQHQYIATSTNHSAKLYVSVGSWSVNTKASVFLLDLLDHPDAEVNPSEDASRAPAPVRNRGPSLQNHPLFPRDRVQHPEAARSNPLANALHHDPEEAHAHQCPIPHRSHAQVDQHASHSAEPVWHPHPASQQERRFWEEE